ETDRSARASITMHMQTEATARTPANPATARAVCNGTETDRSARASITMHMQTEATARTPANPATARAV
ncbi:hypothetical protein B9D92_21925, partial [Mycobacterium tuberculosis]